MHRVTKIKVIEDFHLQLTFDNEEVRTVDIKPYLDKGVFKRLKDPSLFNQAYVAWDTVCWPGELDISPETLYAKSKLVHKAA